MTPSDRLRERLVPGAVLTCVRNTLLPRRDGARHIVSKVVDRWVYCRETATQPSVVVYLPLAEEEVQQLDTTTFRWPLGLYTTNEEHTVTYRVDAA